MDAGPSLKDQPPEEIREQIAATRSALTEKLEKLEHAVKETVDNARETVEETIQSARETIDDTMASVKRTFDVEYQVRERPWLMLGAAAAAGFVVSRCGFARPDLPRTQPNDNSMAVGMTPTSRYDAAERSTEHPSSKNAPSPSANGPSEQPGPAARLKNQLQEEIDQLQGIAIGALMGLFRDGVKEALPTSVSSKVADVIDQATSKLGGDPIRGSVV